MASVTVANVASVRVLKAGLAGPGRPVSLPNEDEPSMKFVLTPTQFYRQFGPAVPALLCNNDGLAATPHEALPVTRLSSEQWADWQVRRRGSIENVGE